MSARRTRSSAKKGKKHSYLSSPSMQSSRRLGEERDALDSPSNRQFPFVPEDGIFQNFHNSVLSFGSENTINQTMAKRLEEEKQHRQQRFPQRPTNMVWALDVDSVRAINRLSEALEKFNALQERSSTTGIPPINKVVISLKPKPLEETPQGDVTEFESPQPQKKKSERDLYPYQSFVEEELPKLTDAPKAIYDFLLTTSSGLHQIAYYFFENDQTANKSTVVDYVSCF